MNLDRFFVHKRERNARCKNKDKVICPILNSISIGDPKKFKSILMPCLHAPELYILGQKGIPQKNMIAIESNPETWKKIKRLRDLDVGTAPREANLAIDHIEADHPGGFNLIYLDFFSQVGFSHMELLRKIFSFRMIRPGGKLILTFGKGRCNADVHELARMLTASGDPRYVPTKVDVLAAVELAKHRKPKYIRDFHYKSEVGNQSQMKYVTTEVQF